MTELTLGSITRVGVDLSKRFYQVHAVDHLGQVVLAKTMSPERFYAWCDERIQAQLRSDERVKRAAQLQGIGPITASAVIATVGDFHQFHSAQQFGAWLGLVPSQNSSGGKTHWGPSPSGVTITCARY